MVHSLHVHNNYVYDWMLISRLSITKRIHPRLIPTRFTCRSVGTLQISTLEICNLFSQACWERVRARATRYVGCSSKHHHHSRHVYIFPIQDSSRFEQQEYLKIFEVHITWIVGVSIDNQSYYIVWCDAGGGIIVLQSSTEYRIQSTNGVFDITSQRQPGFCSLIRRVWLEPSHSFLGRLRELLSLICSFGSPT